MSEQADVLILGGGGVGVSAALYLARRGARVILLEKGLVGGQASGVNHGGVRIQGRHVAEMPIALRARRLWERMEEHVGTRAEFTVCGHLKLARSEEQAAELDAWDDVAAQFGVRNVKLGRNALRAEYPFLGPDCIAGSFLDIDGGANPRLLAPAFAARAREAGAVLLERHEVRAMGHDGALFRLEANGRAFAAPVLLNVAGYWAGAVAERFGEKTPLGATLPNMMVTEPLAHFSGRSIGVVGGDVYLRQTERGNVIIGGGRAEAIDEAMHTRPLPAISRGAMGRAIQLVPQLEGAMIIRSWSGVDGGLPDKIPVIGPSRTTAGLFHAFGFSGHGFMIGPTVGEIMGELILDGRTDVPLDPFDIARFTGARFTGQSAAV